MGIIEFLQLLHDSQLGTALRESYFAFPIVEGIHLIGLAVSIGLIAFTDLRLIGAFLRDVPVEDILHQLRPWLIGGFVVTFVTGILLIWAEGPRIWEISVFPLKLLFIAIAGANAAWFELRYGRRVNEWGVRHEIPRGVKLAGYTSLISWSVVVICGRLIPFLGTTHH
jgi:hypothetical protein